MFKLTRILKKIPKVRIYIATTPCFGYFKRRNHRVVELGYIGIHWDTL